LRILDSRGDWEKPAIPLVNKPRKSNNLFIVFGFGVLND